MPETTEEDMGMSVRLTNDDFRKLLMTPRASVPSATPASVPGTARDASAKTAQTPNISGGSRAELRRKKKSFYAKLKKQEEDKMAELAEKYRDRARERRDGTNQDYQAEDPMNSASAYRAVAPDLKSGMDAAERRRQMIQQSKFLGGDMEHTHLVKGLDYALLQKVGIRGDYYVGSRGFLLTDGISVRTGTQRDRGQGVRAGAGDGEVGEA